jgi:hypothetical protein
MKTLIDVKFELLKHLIIIKGSALTIIQKKDFLNVSIPNTFSKSPKEIRTTSIFLFLEKDEEIILID